MVDALVSGASALRRVGSSPILGTEGYLLVADNSFFATTPIDNAVLYTQSLERDTVVRILFYIYI